MKNLPDLLDSSAKKIVAMSTLILGLLLAMLYLNPIYAIAVSFIIFALALLLLDVRIVFLASLVFLEKIFYLFDITQKLPYFYYPAQIMAVFLVLLIIINLKKIVDYPYIFKMPFLMIAGVLAIAFIIPYYTIGQNLVDSIFPLLIQLGIMGYFVFVFVIKEFKNIEKLKTYIMIIGFILSVIFTIQFLAYSSGVFLDITYSFRYGEIRIIDIASFLPLSFFFIAERIFKSKLKLFTIINFFAHAFTLFYISKARILSIALIIGFFVIAFLQKKISRKFIFVSICILIILLTCVFLVIGVELNYVTDFISEIASRTGTMGIRIDAAEYFIELIKVNPIFGQGFYNIANDSAYFLSGRAHDFFITDVGLIGYTFIFGLLGAAVYMFLWIKALIVSLKIYKLNPAHLFPIGFVIFNLFSSVITIWLYGTPTNIYIAIFFAYCDVVYNRLKQGERDEYINSITSANTTGSSWKQYKNKEID